MSCESPSTPAAEAGRGPAPDGREFAGSFWLAGKSGPRRVGVLSWRLGAEPTLVVEGALTNMLRVENVTATDPERVGVKLVPVTGRPVLTVHGLTDDGTRLTLLEAQNRSYTGGLYPENQVEVIAGVHLVVGANLTGRDHAFRSLRARFAGSEVLGGVEPEAPPRLRDGAILGLVEDAARRWVVLEKLQPASLRSLDRRYLRPAGSLIALATGRDSALLAIEIRDDEHGTWLPVHAAAHQTVKTTSIDPLLGHTDLTLQNLATWFDRAELLGPLPPVVAEALTGPVALESRVLELTTVAEGLHRRLYPEAPLGRPATRVVVFSVAVDRIGVQTIMVLLLWKGPSWPLACPSPAWNRRTSLWRASWPATESPP